MTREWFSNLYKRELSKLKSNIKKFSSLFDKEGKGIDLNRIRDYNVYLNCVNTGFNNDLAENRDPKLTKDERSILNTLADSLDLSNEEIRWITYKVVGIDKFQIDGDFVESQAFAYLAIRSYLKLPISFPSTTRSKKAISGGDILQNF